MLEIIEMFLAPWLRLWGFVSWLTGEMSTSSIVSGVLLWMVAPFVVHSLWIIGIHLLGRLSKRASGQNDSEEIVNFVAQFWPWVELKEEINKAMRIQPDTRRFRWRLLYICKYELREAGFVEKGGSFSIMPSSHEETERELGEAMDMIARADLSSAILSTVLHWNTQVSLEMNRGERS